MNRFISIGLTTLAVISTIPSVSQADRTSYECNTASQTSVCQITPNALVTMARRGKLKAQGIPGGMQLTFEYVLGRVNAEKIVRSAIDEQLMSPDVVNDLSYLNAVKLQLQARLRSH